MSLFRKYVDYLKDNPEGYWFKRKLWGWGWTPARPQGFAVLFVYLVILGALLLTLDENSEDTEVLFMFFLPFLILTTGLLVLTYKTGEPPKWQWGFPKKNREETEPERPFDTMAE